MTNVLDVLKSAQLLEDIELDWEVRRLRIDSWRIIYAIDEEFQQVAVLAIRKRPPYNYEDLPNLLAGLG